MLVGDIVKLENGVTIPADGILIDASQVEVVESSMTGENEAIKKLSYDDCLEFKNQYLINHPEIKDTFVENKHHLLPSPIVLSGTNIAEGIGVMMVLAVGKNSAEGKILELVNQAEEVTPLMKKLNKLAEKIGRVGILAALITMFALYLRFGLEKITNS